MWQLFLKFLKSSPTFNQNGYVGDQPDERDYRYEEIATAPAGVTWVEKSQSLWRRFEPIRNQNGAGACVAFAIALCLGILNYLKEGKFVVLSPRALYARGFVEPAGMNYHDACMLAIKNGLGFEAQLPSEGKGEMAMRDLSDEKESDRLVALLFRGKALVVLPIDFDTIAGVIDTGKPVLLGVRFEDGGFATGVVNLKSGAKNGHGICGLDRTLWAGEKGLIFQNSWTRDGWGFKGLGVVRESQKAGIQFAGYLTELNREPATGKKPQVQISVNSLSVGSVGAQVVKLQVMLQYLGYFPAGECTGNFYGITRQAVRDYQKDNNLPVTGVADVATIKKLNAQFI